MLDVYIEPLECYLFCKFMGEVSKCIITVYKNANRISFLREASLHMYAKRKIRANIVRSMPGNIMSSHMSMLEDAKAKCVY